MAQTKIRLPQVKSTTGATGDVLYKASDGSISQLTATTAGKAIVSAGEGVAPTYSVTTFDDTLNTMGLLGWI